MCHIRTLGVLNNENDIIFFLNEGIHTKSLGVWAIHLAVLVQQCSMVEGFAKFLNN